MTSCGRPTFRAREILIEAEDMAKAAGISDNPGYRAIILRVADLPMADKYQRMAAIDAAKRVRALAAAALQLSGNPWPTPAMEAEYAV